MRDQIVKLLVREGGEELIRLSDNHGRTCLHASCSYPEVFSFLSESVDKELLRAQTQQGWNAWHCLLYSEKEELARSAASKCLVSDYEQVLNSASSAVKDYLVPSREQTFVLYRGALDELRILPGQPKIEFATFATAMSGFACGKGQKGYCEVEIVRLSECSQLGFATPGFERVRQYSWEGVGDTSSSWSVDGQRQLKWHPGQKGSYNVCWKEGDIIGLACNLETMEMHVSVNGDFSHEACQVFTFDESVDHLFPAISMGTGGAVVTNIGFTDFRYKAPSEDFQSFSSFQCYPDFNP